ncbi:formylglycine-generating enzyme family protein [Winogradskyella sp. A3E31]|uniref:formylglycine-generating enzyme family protein n=1 Tax=Winogradskyella sp. A3E31 TaxID=3349637 RepID=UPI00398A83B1
MFLILVFGCKSETKSGEQINTVTTKEKKNDSDIQLLVDQPKGLKTPEGMVWVDGKTFIQGAKANDRFAMMREKPAHKVAVDGFFIDITEVTNKDYKAFVDATGYVTVAERPIDWEEMKKELPPGTPKPHDSILRPGSLIFNKEVQTVVNMENYSQWWTWKIGANWRMPEGPGSSIEDKDDYPVVHIALEDALAYCKWANRRLPTEAEWESAAQGTATEQIYTWGNNYEVLNSKANTWQGRFPTKNEGLDGFEMLSPVKSYAPNSIGIYDMLGNVWELTSDLFKVNHYKEIDTSKVLLNPQGASMAYNPNNPYQKEVIIKGGSFLCHASYCASFRISAKMGTSMDSASDHTGFRTVATKQMLETVK